AGVDLDITYEPAYMGPLIENVEEGKVPEALIDRAVRRVLELKFRLGLFDHPYADLAHAERVIHSQQHQQLALQVAREGIVLLKNQGDLLPLKKDIKSIAVIGPNADDRWNQLGDYSPSEVPQKVNTVLDGIKQEVSPATRVEYVKGCEVIGGKEDFAKAIEAARNSSVAVLVVGEHPNNAGKSDVPPTDGEAYDVASLDLTGAQQDLIKAIQATGTPVVLVVINGRPLSIPWAAAH
ncbi:MAG: glycoside hydrolase family 3 C-terminal domain-containing protein, partial [Acidobacteriota bacterium]